MATNRRLRRGAPRPVALGAAAPILGLLLLTALPAGRGWSREAASASECQAAASQPAVANARALVARDPGNVAATYHLADAWSDAGCFTDAVEVLQSAAVQHPDSQELQTRLRVARSLVGEEKFFDNLDAADAQARLKHDSFRCTALADLEACNRAVRLRPGDSNLAIAAGDASMRAGQPANAIASYRRAMAHAANPHDVVAKIDAAEAQMASSMEDADHVPSVADRQAPQPAPAPRATMRAAAGPAGARHYSNAAPESQSH